MKELVTIFFMIIVTLMSRAQDSLTVQKKLTVNGYVKDLQTLVFDKDFNELLSGNLIHNRINIKWKPSALITAVAEIRNRFFWGEQVKNTPNFARQLKNESEKLDLQKVWLEKKSMVLHSNVERLYMDWRNTEWNIRFGRQRINWGIATTWNPNDIFNSYNFLDFDYEERQGIDGAKVEYLFDNGFKTEMAYAHNGKKNRSVAALKYSVNRWNYDMQLITGWYNDHPTVGAGWAGPINGAGFKGEIQYFFAAKDSGDHLNISLEGDYMFKKGWYVNAGLLYNSGGLYTPVEDWEMINLQRSPENLMPTKWNMILTCSREFTPLLSATFSFLYAPGTNLVILFPTLQYNLTADLGVHLVWQSFLAEKTGEFQAVNHQSFLRMKWSF